VPGSTYELYRSALELRASLGLGTGSLSWVEGYGDEVVAFTNGRTLVVANLGAESVALPADVRPLLCSAGAGLAGDATGLLVPTDVTVWADLPVADAEAS